MITVGIAGCKNNKETGKSAEDENYVAENVEDMVEETGVVVFDDDYSIITHVNAKILSSNFKEGDFVSRGQLLYSLDNVELKNQIEQTKISLEKASEAYRQSVNAQKDLTVFSYAEGLVTKLYFHQGDYVSVGSKIADVVDNHNMILKIPFNASDKENLHVGANAEITMKKDGSRLYGVISKIYDIAQAFDGGKSGIMTEIHIVNPGALKKGDEAFAMAGNRVSIESGTLENKTEQSISAAQSGQIEKLFIEEGIKTTNGMKVMTIKNNGISNAVNTAALQVKEIQNNLEQLNGKLSDYEITAPIDGIVTKKIAKASDYATPYAPLAVIADNSNLYVDVDIDEIYINKISFGQTATATGNKGIIYHGSVIKIDDAGVAKNGVTYYTVRIKLDNHENLMESMNVDVKIDVGGAEK